MTEISIDNNESPVTALFVAHPGHEVRIHGWLEQCLPTVFILTDGSGRSGQSRIDATRRYLARLGVKSGSIFGRFTDHEVYSAILRQDFSFFTQICDDLASAFAAAGVRRVIGDAAEGYNTAHDVSRMLLDAATVLAEQVNGAAIENYDFPVVGRPDDCPPHLRAQALWLHLDKQTFDRKIDAARTFYPELAAEVDDAVHGRGESPLKSFLAREHQHAGATVIDGLDAFRVECLCPAGGGNGRGDFDDVQPFYEFHSERQVAAGHYDRVIRYQEHMRPIASALRAHTEKSRSADTGA